MHEKRIEIRWRDLDAYAHVNQAVYLTYAEEILDDWIAKRLGIRGGVWDYVAARMCIDYRGELTLKDEGDRRMVETAAAGGASCIVTTDREFLSHRGWGSVEFVTPAEWWRAAGQAG